MYIPCLKNSSQIKGRHKEVTLAIYLPALIPKVVSPTSLGDISPISLHGYLYKIETKVLAEIPIKSVKFINRVPIGGWITSGK